MEEKEIAEVAAILARWNPLGDAAAGIPDLEGYRIEAIDIICAFGVFGRAKKIEAVVRDTLNQAFHLSLTPAECTEPAKKILGVLSHRKKSERL
jgi:hypothetical protein